MKDVLLAVVDSPTRQTGFSLVGQKLMSRWKPYFERIDVWAIGYSGFPGRPGTVHQDLWQNPPFVLYPATYGDEPWYDARRLQALLNLILQGDYTHLWILQDHFLLTMHHFAQCLEEACRRKNIKSFYYCPVDAPMNPDWAKIVECVDVPVAYTEYGRQELIRHVGALPCSPQIGVIPHGVDTAIYRPLSREERAKLRGERIHGWLNENDLLLINVNANQRRKDPVRCLETLAALHRAGHKRFKLLMHMPDESSDQVSLESAAQQLGLIRGQEWDHTGNLFASGDGTLAETDVNLLYNIADFYLTTTLGEGWGLGITEALAAGLTVLVPDHTACREIAHEVSRRGMLNRVVALPVEKNFICVPQDNSRLRRRVDVDGAVEVIGRLEKSSGWQPQGLNGDVKYWLSWDRIALEWMELFRKSQKRKTHFYIEYGGGLGDVFSGLYHRGSYNLLENLRAGEQATVALICHNPHAQELFENHPKRSQISILNLGYWNPHEDSLKRAEHKLPRPGGLNRLPEGRSEPVQFYPTENDKEVLARLNGRPYVVLAPAAGESSRNIPEPLLDLIVRRLLKVPGLRLVVTGRSYQRFDRREVAVNYHDPRVINLVDQLTVPGTAVLLQGALGLVTCHSALNILGWHLGIPQLLLYPDAVKERHFRRKDEWSFGADNGKTWHCTFQEFRPQLLEEFVERLNVPAIPPAKAWVTISVVCFNNLELTQQCLRSIYEHSNQFDVISTDNASTDGTWEWLQQFAKEHSNVTLIRNEENLGFIKPHNHALTRARGDYFVVLNNDLEVSADWLPTMTAAFDQNPRLAICGLDGNCCALDEQMNGVPCAERLEYVEACCLMIPTALARACGLFSTYLHFAYGEDSDLSLRLREQGYDIATVNLAIRHVRAATAKLVARKMDLDLIAAGNHAILQKRWSLYLKRRDFRYQVLLIRREAAGDVLFTTPIVAALKAKWPLSEIRVLTKFPEIFRNNPNVVDATSTEVPREKFDFVFDLDLAYERRPKMHVIDAYAEACGFELKERHRRLSIYLQLEERKFAEQFARMNLAVIHAGPTAWPGRNWPKDRFEQVIRSIKSGGFQVAVVGGVDNWTFSEADVNLVGTTTVHELAAILERAKLFFGIDSFPANLAQAVGCPAVVLFGAISPEYRLTGEKVIGLHGAPARTPCIGEHHRLPPPITFSSCGGECMRAITTEMAIDSIKRLL